MLVRIVGSPSPSALLGTLCPYVCVKCLESFKVCVLGGVLSRVVCAEDKVIECL